MLLVSRALIFLAIAATLAHAEAPGLESLYPAGGRAGDLIQVKVLGKGLDKNNPVGWCSNPAVTLQAVPLTGDKTKDKALAGLWQITIAQDAAPGPCLIRFLTNEGSTPPHIFEVGTLPEYSEQEPNDSFKESSSSSYSYSSSPADAPPSPTTAASPQSSPSSSNSGPPSPTTSTPLAPPSAPPKTTASSTAPAPPTLSPIPPTSASPPTAPFTLNGLFAKEGDSDTFPIRVRKGIPLTFELHGYALGSSMDPAMRLLDERGIELAASHDTHNLDPLIRHTPTADTTLHVQLFAFVHPPQSDIAFKGTPSHIYRLHVTENPITSLTPTVINNASASSSSSSSYSNSSSTPTTSPHPLAPNSPPTTATPKSSSSSPKPAPATSQALASPAPSALTPPFTLTATLPTSGQESHHTLHARQGDDLQITVRAKAIRSPLEAVLRIEDPTGKVLQTVDDSSKIAEAGSFSVLDPSLRFKAPAEADYRIVVSDRFQTGSPDHRYELSVRPWQPTVTATLADHAFLLPPGKTTDIKLTITLDGIFPSKLIARATHLPRGITCADAELPTKTGELKLTLKAPLDAPPSQTPITIEILPATTPPTTAVAPPPSSSSSYSNSSSTPSSPATPTVSAPPKSSSSSSSNSSSPSVSGTSIHPLTLATYPIPFKDLRGDLLLPTDTHPWLTVPATIKDKAEDKSKPADKDKAMDKTRT